VPLTAIVDGETIIGPDLSTEEWTAWNPGIKRTHHNDGLLRCAGTCKDIKKGDQHFYHAVDTGCNYAEESREHLEIKYQIYRTCKSENWETYVEFPAPDRTWISDVYAIRMAGKLFLKYRSAPSLEGPGRERQEIPDEGIESYWLLDNFLERSKDFASWYILISTKKRDRREETSPTSTIQVFETGPEINFHRKGHQECWTASKNQMLFTTNNPEIPLAGLVRRCWREITGDI